MTIPEALACIGDEVLGQKSKTIINKSVNKTSPTKSLPEVDRSVTGNALVYMMTGLVAEQNS